MRCGIQNQVVPEGPGCKTPGTFRAGCIYDIPWESLALAAAGTDATLKHVPRSGVQRVLDFIVDLARPIEAATGPGAPAIGAAAYLSALTVNGISYMPQHNSSSGAALSANKYPLAAFAREVSQNAGGPLASLESGEGTPFAQFGVHNVLLGTEDDVTFTIINHSVLAINGGGTIQVLQLSSTEEGPTGGSALP